MSNTDLALCFLLVVLYTVIAVRLDRLSITMPLVVVLTSALIGSYALGLVQIPLTTVDTESLTEITLALW